MRSRNWFGEALSIGALNFRNAWARPMLPAIMVIGFLAVVLVMVTVLSIGQGLSNTFGHTGSKDVALVLSSGAYSESTSHISQTTVQAVGSQPGVAQGSGGPLISPEFVTTASVPKQGSNVRGNIVLRGVTDNAFRIHKQVHIIQGRRFKPGVHEVIVGRQAAKEYQDLDLGDTLHNGNVNWKVVGIFAANGSLHESEVWTDAAGLQTAFHMGNNYSDVYAKLTAPAAFKAFQAAVKKDPRLNVEAQTEKHYFAQYAKSYQSIITTAGMALAILMALGAIIGAINLMYTSLSTRIGEMATLRAVGFRRLPVLTAMLWEGLMFGFIGGILGCAIAYFAFNGYQAATAMTGLTQVAFQFAVTPALLAAGIIFALIMGFIGGLFPAIRAARLPLAKALRET
jgi:putative ABC transport system permease protein